MTLANVGTGAKSEGSPLPLMLGSTGFYFAMSFSRPRSSISAFASNETSGTRIVEIIPSFQGAPEDWLDVFDTRGSVPDLYNITSPDGIIQILVSPHVKIVLENIKRLPGRRVAGARAEAFLINPYAALGEAASETIDEAQFMSARAEAGLLFERFTAHIERDAIGYPIVIALCIRDHEGSRPNRKRDPTVRR